MEKSLNQEIKDKFAIADVDIRTYSPLTLAYIGDGIFDVIIRSIVVGRGNTPVNQLHHKTSHVVKAHSQAIMAEALMDVLTDTEKRLVAYHEVGHALVAALEKHTQPVSKITIVPHTQGTLGYTLHLPEEEKFLMSKEDILAEIRTLLAGRSSEEIEKALGLLDKQGISYEILFLDAPDDVLMRRYSETRRRHPISIAEGISTREAFQKEHQILRPFKERANYIIDTALLSTAQNKERICELFVQNGGAKNAMRLTIMSFGFKFGVPADSDLVLDVRCLPNPFYVPELKFKTGLDQEVVDFVMGHPEAQELLRRYEAFLEYALPLYVKEGKSQLTIAVGCTGGKHRSITFARKIAEYCEKLGYQPGVQHRDASR